MRRDLITDAAIQLVAEQGMRGLTHRAVDRRAGLPEGSTSAYFRTRKALIEGFVERLADQERFVPDPDDVAGSIARTLDSWLVERNRTLARYSAMLEATHHPELRPIMVHSPREQATAIAKMLGHQDPERAGAHFTAFLEGLLFYRLVGGGSTVGPAPGTEESVRDLKAAVEKALRP
ncbi:transcriptional regulator, TetR family [Lentzea albidocapillata subsp. violacea]|uniref:Transcriptional regulator, TetR family n=1 Tax=Lentzea albidocapillata subsp. violacea TaxID=128104 RepID=A0A1G9AZL1_9PSEU|nr:TetR family transcriptional regulator [Lentzea albidocapillata]SDK32638.1 transcriptional regulator, TetR family [Lentzea albidocapillata subsp. violacea]